MYGEVDYDKLIKLIKDSSNELRIVLNNIDEVFVKHITNDYVEVVSNKSNKKKDNFMDWCIYDIAKYILHNRLDTSEIYDVINHENYVICCLVHENFPKLLNFIFSNLKSDLYSSSEYINTIQHINKSFIDSERISKMAFDTADNTLLDISNYYRLLSINYHFTSGKNKQTGLNTSQNGNVLSIEFSQLINKHSLALNFNKKLNKMENRLNFNRTNLLHLMCYYSTIIRTICTKKNINEYIDKNDMEVFSRYSNDFESDIKSLITRLRKHMSI